MWVRKPWRQPRNRRRQPKLAEVAAEAVIVGRHALHGSSVIVDGIDVNELPVLRTYDMCLQRVRCGNSVRTRAHHQERGKKGREEPLPDHAPLPSRIPAACATPAPSQWVALGPRARRAW